MAALTLLALLGVIAGCTEADPGVLSRRSTTTTTAAAGPLPSTPPSSPPTTAPLRRAPPVTDLTGTFVYGDAGGSIWTVDAATGVRNQITHTEGDVDFDPHWSADASQIVFRTSRYSPPDPTHTGYNGIYVIGIDGSGEHAVNPPGGGLFPNWSPDGKTIIFSSPRPDGSEGLFAVHPDGSGMRDLQTYGEHVEWSVDGAKLLIDRLETTEPQNWDVSRAASDLTGLTRLTSAPGDDHLGAWSPDGKSIVFTSQRAGAGDVWLMAEDGSGQQPLIDWPGVQSAEWWFPDGRILFADYPHGGDPRWYVVQPDGSGLRSVPVLDGVQPIVDWTPVQLSGGGGGSKI